MLRGKAHIYLLSEKAGCGHRTSRIAAACLLAHRRGNCGHAGHGGSGRQDDSRNVAKHVVPFSALSRPVMLARKKLSGRKTEIEPPDIRLAINLRPPIRLADAKIGLPMSSATNAAVEKRAYREADKNAEDSN